LDAIFFSGEVNLKVESLMIENEPRELTLIYHSEKTDDKKARAYVESFPSLAIKTLDLARENVTETQLAQIGDKMQVPIAEMVDISYDDRSTVFRQTENIKQMDSGELLTLIRHNPKLLATPILIIGHKAYKYSTSYHLINEYLDEGVKSVSDVVNPEEKKS
jgi:arsenate reductase-like glutaredoxin family protein